MFQRLWQNSENPENKLDSESFTRFSFRVKTHQHAVEPYLLKLDRS